MTMKTLPKAGDRIKHFGGKFGTITRINKGIAKYSITWDGGKTEVCSQKEFDKWYELCSTNSTSVVASAPASPLAQLSLEASTSSDCVSAMSGVSRFSNLDTQAFPSLATLNATTSVVQTSTDVTQTSTLLPVPRPARPSQLKVNGKELTTQETVSQQLPTRSPNCNPHSFASKKLPDCSTAPTSQELAAVTSGMFWGTFPSSGSIVNGFVSAQDTLAPPSVESGYCWLESPGALSFSGKGRPPGLTKSESKLKNQGLLKKGEVLNPDFLSNSFNIPKNYLDPSECRTAAQLLEDSARQQEIFLTPELQPLHSSESSISTHLSEELAEPKLKRKRSPNLKPASGSLSACTSIKKGKPYTSYQYSYDVRDADSKRGWRTVKVGVPKYKVNTVTNLINQGKPILEILEALKK